MKLSTKQKSENAIKWLKALLSGEYLQGSGRLGNEEGGYCCWGVACKILLPSYDAKADWNFEVAPLIGYVNEGHEGPLPFRVITNNHSHIELFKSARSLVELNDDLGLTFEEIASILILRAEDIFETIVAEEIKKWYNNDSIIKKKINTVFKNFRGRVGR